MKHVAKEYNEQIQEEELEQKEEMKDLIEETQNKLENLIQNQTNELKSNLNISKQRREEELSLLHQQYENELRKRDDEKHFSAQLLTQNNERLEATTNHIMSNFDTQIKDMFQQINTNLQKDEEEERRRDEVIRKRELKLINKIDKKNEKINKLRSSQEDLEFKMQQSREGLDATFDRIDPKPYYKELDRASKLEIRKVEEAQKQEKEISLMEVEDYRMQQIMLEERRIKELKIKEDEERNRPKEEVKISEGELQAIEQKIQLKYETQKWEEMEELEKKRKKRECELQEKLDNKKKEEDNLYK